jgi:zinc/manganese transport system permease protein
VIAGLSIVAIVVLYRPLLLSSVTPDVAEARGINQRAMDLAFLVVVALVTTMAVPVVGSMLIFSLLIGPPAAARSFTNRPSIAIGLSILLALVTVWVAIAVSYETNLPIGFFVGAISAFAYGVGRGWTAWKQRHGRIAHGAADPASEVDLSNQAAANPALS